MRVPTYNDNGNKINWLVSICMFTLMFQMSGFLNYITPTINLFNYFPFQQVKEEPIKEKILAFFKYV